MLTTKGVDKYGNNNLATDLSNAIHIFHFITLKSPKE
jgi:hypothetical protein